MIYVLLFLIAVIIIALAIKIRNYLAIRDDGFSIKKSLELVELPIITFYQGDTKLNFLLDTGANKGVLDKKVADRIKVTPMTDSTPIIGMEGNVEQVPMCTIVFWHNKRQYESTLCVRDMTEAFDSIKAETGVTIHGILGTSFFEQYGYVLDFATYLVYPKK